MDRYRIHRLAMTISGVGAYREFERPGLQTVDRELRVFHNEIIDEILTTLKTRISEFDKARLVQMKVDEL